MKDALIVWGGWDGHEPELVADLCREILEGEGFSVQVENDLEAFCRADWGKLSLVVPIWTMGDISQDQLKAVTAGIESGVGMGGCHGGMCDAFRNATEWHWITGGQWVAHPGNDGVEYTVRITDRNHPITEGLPDFPIKSEQYYLHTDPSNEVLAVTHFPIAEGPHVPNGSFDMPVVWTRKYGKGKVFYSSLGHHRDVIETGPAREIMRRGLNWASR